MEIERREQGNGNNPRGRSRKKVPDPKISPKVLHKNPIHFFFLPHKFNHSVFWEWFLFHNSISSLVLRKLVGNGSGRRDMELGGVVFFIGQSIHSVRTLGLNNPWLRCARTSESFWVLANMDDNTWLVLCWWMKFMGLTCTYRKLTINLVIDKCFNTTSDTFAPGKIQQLH